MTGEVEPEEYSKLRPLVGTRATQTPGPSCIEQPFAANSAPMPVPHRLAALRSKLAAIASPAGHCVVVPAGPRMPCGPSHMDWAGMPSRGIGSVLSG